MEPSALSVEVGRVLAASLSADVLLSSEEEVVLMALEIDKKKCRLGGENGYSAAARRCSGFVSSRFCSKVGSAGLTNIRGRS